MIKELKKVGNSNAVFLDKTLMELIGLEEGGEVQLTVREGSIILTPTHPRTVDPERFEKAVEKIMTAHDDVLRRLAK